MLGYSDPAKALRMHVDEEDKGVDKISTPGGKQNVIIINESGLYSLILSSKLLTARHKNRTSKNFFSNPLTSLKISSII